MPAYNFMKQFAPLIENGVKTTTIRKRRKRPTRPGDTLYLYTGMRTKDCRKLLETECVAVLPITINRTPQDDEMIVLDGAPMVGWEIDALVHDDVGDLLSISEFVDFFDDHYGLPFDGVWITWNPRYRSIEGE